tara:strand:- start:172 stop:498 length:327 start_codon:yes stop_codon:yes gene_type:complete
MSDGARLYRYAVTFEPLFALHELEPEIADDELLALGGTRTLIVRAASQDQAGEIVSVVMQELRPRAHYQQVSIEWEFWPLSAHEEMVLRQKRPDLVAGCSFWPGGAPL